MRINYVLSGRNKISEATYFYLRNFGISCLQYFIYLYLYYYGDRIEESYTGFLNVDKHSTFEEKI